MKSFMEQLNRIEIRGTVGNVKLQTFTDNEAAWFSVATNYAYKDKSGNAVIDTSWHNVVAREGRNIKEGDFMALADGKLIHTNRKFEAVVKKLASELADKKSTFITVIYGEGADEAQAQTVAEALQKEAKNAEIQIVFGGQPVYSYIISVE